MKEILGRADGLDSAEDLQASKLLPIDLLQSMKICQFIELALWVWGIWLLVLVEVVWCF